MARSWSLELPRSSAAPRRSCARRRGASVSHGWLVLLRNSLPRQVREMQKIEGKLRGWMGEARSIESHRKTSKMPTAMATRRRRFLRPRGARFRVFGGKRRGGVRGIYGGLRRSYPVRIGKKSSPIRSPASFG